MTGGSNGINRAVTKAMIEERGFTYLFVTHEGRVVEYAPASEIFAEPLHLLHAQVAISTRAARWRCRCVPSGSRGCLRWPTTGRLPATCATA